MPKIYRTLASAIEVALNRGKSVLLLGARQVGKTTLLTDFPIDHTISLARPAIPWQEITELLQQELWKQNWCRNKS
jgi:predicted AAA+ superfamily ATPase